MLIGTVAYMSPEQATARSADKRSDVWAFGCVLFEMLTGRPAFAGGRRSDVLARYRRGRTRLDDSPGKDTSLHSEAAETMSRKGSEAAVGFAAVARIEIDDALAGPGPDVTARAPEWSRLDAPVGDTDRARGPARRRRVGCGTEPRVEIRSQPRSRASRSDRWPCSRCPTSQATRRRSTSQMA